MNVKRDAAAVALALILMSGGIAHADNTNDNSNTNTNSDVGGYLSIGGSDASKGWLPTKSDWPPSDISVGGLSGDSGSGGDDKTPPTPIVMPKGVLAQPMR